MDQDELLDKYLAGKLNAEELREFQELRNSDSEFEKVIGFHVDLSKVLIEDERVRLKTLLSSKKKTINTNKRSKGIILAVLGTLIALGLIFVYKFNKKQNSPAGIYASHFEPYPNTYRPVTRNQNNNAETQGFTAYESGNYALAAEKFEEFLLVNQDPSVIFYQGICYHAVNNIPLAIQKMEQIVGLDFLYVAEANWYLGLSYLKQNQFDPAKLYFEQYIKLSEDQEKIEQVKQILEMIK